MILLTGLYQPALVIADDLAVVVTDYLIAHEPVNVKY